MDEQALKQQVQQIVSDVMGAAAEGDDSPGAWDSIQNLNIILAVEAATGMQFSPDEIEHMRSVEQIVKVVQSKQAH